MALSIGELVGYLRIDDSGVEEGLTRSQQRVKNFSAAAGAAGAAAGGAIGAGLSSAMTSAVEFESATAKLKAQFGEGTAMAGAAGEAAGRLYSNGYGESMANVAEVTSSVGRNISAMWGASSTEIEGVTGKVMSLSQAFDQDFNSVVRATDQLITTGLAPNADAALDLIAAGFQAGINDADDLLDTFTEYGTQFRKMGIEGPAAVGLISQGLKAGARDADIVADAVKEFSIRAIDGSKGAADAYKALGLDAQKMTAQIAKGGPEASAGMQTVLDRLREMKDPVAQSAAAVGLFGTQAEDLGAALFALDPSTAVDALGQVEGAAAKVDKQLADTAEARVKTMQRSLEMFGASLITTKGPLGDVAAGVAAFGPAGVSMAGSLAMVGMFIGPLIVKLGAMAVSAAVTAGSFIASMARVAMSVAVGVAGMIADIARWVIQVTVQGALAVASMARTAAAYLLQWTIMAAQSVARAAMMAAAWVVGVIVPAAAALVRMAITAAAYVLQWVIMAAGSMASAIAMAAAWIVAMGPVGWIIAAVIALVALIIANWDTVKQWTVDAWNAVSQAVSDAAAAVVGFVEGLVADVVAALEWFVGLHVMAAEWFGGLVRSAIEKGGELLAWVIGLPGEILAALGDLGKLLLDAGRDVVTGLWNGILGAGRWLWDKIMGWARQFIPGPILQFLGIASPSKWMRDHVGRWIPEGIGDGILRNARAAGDAARKVAAQTAAAAQEGALSGFSSTTAGMGSGPARGLASVRSRDTIIAGDVAAAVYGGVLDALDGARMAVDGRGVARLVNRQNLTDARRSITAAI